VKILFNTQSAEKEVIFFIADISGYTRFIVSNEKEMVHSQIIVRDLITTIISEIKAPMQVIRLEGDAIFLYVDKGDPLIRWELVQATLLETLITIFRVFSNKITELTLHKICNCNACNNVDQLKLKIVAHSGKTMFFNINEILELSGTAPILIHRLLKNSVTADEYVLMTESAYEDLMVASEDVELGSECYDELGTIKTYVYYPPPPEPFSPDASANYPQVFIDTLRSEVSKEYAVVAQDPEQGFHFHTGRRLADMLDYKDKLLDQFPEEVIESFAGTGNVFKLGEIKPEEYVLDIGCGAGLDSLIAARMVGNEGKVIGVDMTPEMIAKARQNAAEAGLSNVEFIEDYNEQLPIPTEWADVIISNGAINLSPEKDVVFSEMFRVLKPGGRLQIADILVQKSIPNSAKNNLDLWAG
jgi:2-polyprenyl-3-methyl-5-hydroxy-6-metoxy-1,4-benzoquinol methylase